MVHRTGVRAVGDVHPPSDASSLSVLSSMAAALPYLALAEHMLKLLVCGIHSDAVSAAATALVQAGVVPGAPCTFDGVAM
eukprot:12302938-Prorocentrum_lima.AAC.1